MQISHPSVSPSFPVQRKRPTSTPRLSILPVELAKDHLLKIFKQSKTHTQKSSLFFLPNQQEHIGWGLIKILIMAEL